jgi:FkbM family methyltransferase
VVGFTQFPTTAREERRWARQTVGMRAWLGSVLTRAGLTSRPWRVRFDGFPPVFLRFGTTDPPVLDQVLRARQYAARFPEAPRTIVDAGAHIGLAAVYFAVTYPDAEILAIEPDPGNFELLRRNTRKLPGVVPIHGALEGETGYVKIVNPTAENWMYRVAAASPDDPAAVPALTVPDLLARSATGRIDLLKLDIEGAEVDVLSTSDEWIDRVETIAIELHDRYRPGCTEAFERVAPSFPNRTELGEVNWASRSAQLAPGG